MVESSRFTGSNLEARGLEIVKRLGLEVSSWPDSQGEMTARCPLHDDSTPSLCINVRTGKFHCWAGCVAGNSLEELVFKLTGQSIEIQQANWIELFKSRLRPAEPEKVIIPSTPILPLALSGRGWKYLSGRGFTEYSIRKWKLAYWQDEDAVVIPIKDHGYALRKLSGDKRYKFLPGSQVSKTLFGWEHADFRFNNAIIVVEGLFDCIWLHQIGFPSAVALFGTNLSNSQRAMLQEFGLPVYLMLDGDVEGQKAAAKISQKLKGEFVTKVCHLPSDSDPNECSKEEIETSLKNARRI